MQYINEKYDELVERLAAKPMDVSIREKFDGQFVEFKIDDKGKLVFRTKRSPFTDNYLVWFSNTHRAGTPEYAEQIPDVVFDFHSVFESLKKNDEFISEIESHGTLSFELFNTKSSLFKIDGENCTFVNTPYPLSAFDHGYSFYMACHKNVEPSSYLQNIQFECRHIETDVKSQKNLVNLIKLLVDPFMQQRIFMFGKGEGYILTFKQDDFSIDLKVKVCFNHETKASEVHREWIANIDSLLIKGKRK